MFSQLAYAKGVLDGDGYIDNQVHNRRICLETTERKFATKFSASLESLNLKPKTTERTRYMRTLGIFSHFYTVRTSVSSDELERIMLMNPSSIDEKISWLCGFYDSEGTLSITRYPSRICYNWSISNTNTELIKTLKSVLGDLGISYDYRCTRRETRVGLRHYHLTVHRVQVQNKVGVSKLLAIMGAKFT